MWHINHLMVLISAALISGIFSYILIAEGALLIWQWSGETASYLERFITFSSAWFDSLSIAATPFFIGEGIITIYGLLRFSYSHLVARFLLFSSAWLALVASLRTSLIDGPIPGGYSGESILDLCELVGIPVLVFWVVAMIILYLSPLLRIGRSESRTIPVRVIKEPEIEQKFSYHLPDRELLKRLPSGVKNDQDRHDLDKKSKLLEEKLAYFGIRGKVVSAIVGPVVTVFEYRPAQDVKVSRVLAFEDDIALALQALSVRCRAPIPGKSVIGFEVAYAQRKGVLLGDCIAHGMMKKELSLPLALGVDIVGRPIILDLKMVPHLLVAGATGSGKSVALSSMLMSLILSRTPDELSLILIDPKRLEFSLYADLPHLIFPHITEPGEAVEALSWLVGEMERRYKKLAQAGSRSLEEYQNITGEKLPYIVVCIDELADLMMTAARDVEHYLIRLAQMARAAGIHLIVATQRPSVDVITGIIKANFPTRIAFRVVSKIDSRTILDIQGAEKLVGKGDLLMLDSGGSIIRAHGAYVSTEEITAIVSAAKNQRKAHYIERSEPTREIVGPDDAILKEAEKILAECDEVSVSLMQRRLRIGYNRAARIMEEFEDKGRILTTPGSKMKRVVR